MIYENEIVSLYQGDTLELLKKVDDSSVDVIVSDPPYFLSNGGISCRNGNMVSVDKGEWDKLPENYTLEEFYNEFLTQAKRILKDNGTIWLFGTMHNIYTLGYLLTKSEFKIMNNITWQKTNPAPNLSCRMFTHSTETILWAKQNKDSKHFFNYDLMRSLNMGKQMKDVWTTSTTKKSEKKHGKHPTQKPLEIMERIILASSQEGDTVMDCFSGSGTTLVAGYSLNRNMIGIEIEPEYNDICIKRLKELEISKRQLSLL